MVKQLILLRQFIRNSDEGLTLIELLVSIVIAAIVLSLAFSMTLYNRKLYLEDEARTNVNQNLRAAMDLVGTDIKQAGERITDSNFPVVEVTGGSQLILRRRLDLPILRVCEALLSGSNNAVFIAKTTSPPQGCAPLPDSNGDGWPDNLEAWRNYRCSRDGTPNCQGNVQEQVRAYIYNGNGEGQYFTYVGEDRTTFQIQTIATNIWTRAYSTSSSIYLLEERKFSLSADGVLQLVIDQGPPQNLVNQLSSFQVKAFIPPISPTDDGGRANFTAPGANWRQVRYIQLDLTAQSPTQILLKPRNLTASGQFFPRNILSR